MIAKAILLFTSSILGRSAGFTINTSSLSGKPIFSAKKTAITRNSVEGSIDFGEIDGSDVRIGIIKTRWNKESVDSLLGGAKDALKDCGVKDENIFVKEVPGSYELPLAARFLALSGTVDAIICMGVLIKGDTMHFEYICSAVSSGIMNVQLQTSVPCIFGVLTAKNDEQVKERAFGEHSLGPGWGNTAVEMALLRNEALGKISDKKKVGFSDDDEGTESQDPEKLKDPLRSIGF